MTQTNNWFFDELGKLMTDAAGVANGLQREGETFLKIQAEKIISNMDLVRREEFEAVKHMVVKAREDTEKLTSKLADIEEELRKVKNTK